MIEIFATTLNQETRELTVRFAEKIQTSHGEHEITNSRAFDEDLHFTNKDSYTNEDVEVMLAELLKVPRDTVTTRARLTPPVLPKEEGVE